MRISQWRARRSLWVVSLLLAAACDPTQLAVKSPAASPDLERMPEVEAVDHRGNRFVLSEARAKGPVVIVFYRGHW